MSKLAIVILGIAFAGGCATVKDEAGSGSTDADTGPVCLSDHQITSFSPVGDIYLYVEGIGDRHFLFTMERGCFGLRHANTIGIPDRVGRICSNSFDRVIYRDIARGAESCRILDIEAVVDREDADRIAEAREAARREQ
jgi:hypothetical protein